MVVVVQAFAAGDEREQLTFVAEFAYGRLPSVWPTALIAPDEHHVQHRVEAGREEADRRARSRAPTS